MYVERRKQLKDLWGFMTQYGVKYSFSGHSHNYFAGFALQKQGFFMKAIYSIPEKSFILGDEMHLIVLPPLSGEKGKTGFSVSGRLGTAY